MQIRSEAKNRAALAEFRIQSSEFRFVAKRRTVLGFQNVEFFMPEFVLAAIGVFDIA
jgi:hypothetical protein